MFNKKENISFAEFMEQALYHPKFGYYMQNTCPIGQDFTTAPEKSKALAYACAKSWQQLALADATLCEIGPGTGQLMLDTISFLQEWNSLPKSIWLIELNPHRLEQQKAKFDCLSPAIKDKLHWYDSIPNTPWQGLIIANEIIDAQPFEIITYQNKTWYELQVSCPELTWAKTAINKKLTKILPKDLELPDGYTTEVRSSLVNFIKNISCNMTAGGILLLDYGYPAKEYYHPQRIKGTSMAFYAGKKSYELLSNPGQQDLTAHVDFTDLAKILQANDFGLDAYMNKAQFLMQTKSHEHLLNYNGMSYHKASMAFKSLIFEMGDVFKVMLASKNNTGWQQWLKGYGVERLGIK